MSAAASPERLPQDPGELLALLIRDNFILANATVRRSVLSEVGGYDVATTGAEDYDLWLRIVAAGHTAVRVPELMVVQRDMAGSFSKDELRIYTAIRDIIERLSRDHALPEVARSAARERLVELNARVSALDGSSRGRAAALRARRLVGASLRPVRKRKTYDETPAPVAQAFGDLREI
jgi:hypothetical protein